MQDFGEKYTYVKKRGILEFSAAERASTGDQFYAAIQLAYQITRRVAMRSPKKPSLGLFTFRFMSIPLCDVGTK